MRLPSAFTVNHDLEGAIFRRWLQLDRPLQCGRHRAVGLAGKVSRDLQEIVIRRPRIFADLLRTLDEAPDHVVMRITREVRAGAA